MALCQEGSLDLKHILEAVELSWADKAVLTYKQLNLGKLATCLH